MVCRNKERAEAAKDEIVEQSKNQVGNLLHVCPRRGIHHYLNQGSEDRVPCGSDCKAL